ncbi:unnamed protein product [Pelagomonas calceolata]|uniref:Uncharacterized protein n=1 Tax=Pelagomonas calceolata TaxID=35677 RepID=A0A8J2X1C4_9STRA|nr:unnamed protein product [Pelagomonas calceolata]|mmetsp:Transcript_18709/g.57824  ORF Transcript_18709/g.57824 Transcript_18709/m.57824 type:complete len:305 (-) Transcript_18709:62-976(-)
MNIVGRFLQHLRGCPYGDDATSSDVGLDLDHLYGDALSPDSPRASASGRWLQGGRRTRKRSRTPPMMVTDDGSVLRDPAPKRRVSIALEPCLRAPSPPSARRVATTWPLEPSPPSSPLSRSSGNTSDGDLSRSCSRLCLDGGRRTSASDLYALEGRTSLDGRRPSEGRLSSRYSVLGLDGSHRRKNEPSRYDADPYALACDLETVPWLSSGVGPIRARRAVRFAFGTKAPGPRPSGARRLSDAERCALIASRPDLDVRGDVWAKRLDLRPTWTTTAPTPELFPPMRRRPSEARSLSSLSEDDNK